MRRMLSVAAVLAAGLLVPSTADAAIPQVFTKTRRRSTAPCRPPGSASAAPPPERGRIASWDNVPIDVAVAFPPAPATAPTARTR